MSLDKDEHSSSKNSKARSRAIGLGLMAVAGCFLTVANSVAQYTLKKWPKTVSVFEILLIRSVCQLVLVIPFMVYGKVNVYGNSLKSLAVLVVMGIAEASAIVSFYEALKRIPVGDATVIQFTAPVFTTALSFLFLRKGCGLLDIACGVVSFGGIVLIARPSFLFPHHAALAHHLGPVVYQPGTSKYLEGVGFAILAALCLSFFYILNKITGKWLDMTLTIFYPSVIGLIVCPISLAVSHHTWFTWGVNTWGVHTWGFVVVVGFTSFTGLMLMAESLQLEDAGPAILIRNLDVVYAFVLEYVLINLKPDQLSLIGASIVLIATSLIAISRTCFSQMEACQKLQTGKESEPSEERFSLLSSDDTKRRTPFLNGD